jgi:cytochrome c oxidase subunit 2
MLAMNLFSLGPPDASYQLPPAFSQGALAVDDIYNAMYWFSLVFTVVITAATLYFVVKYKRKKGDVLETPGNYTVLEITWTVIPILFIIVLFHVGFKGYISQAVAYEGSMEIRVRGTRWKWEFEYPNGMRENGVLMVPVNKPVKLILSSDDVIHSFYVPGVRLKKDAVPGMYSTIAFLPDQIGDMQVFCAEYCGTSHSGMLATVKVVPQNEFDDYMKEGPKKPDDLTVEQWGEKLFAQNNCNTCHSRDGSKSPGPTFKGVYGRQESICQPSSLSIKIDESYMKESIQKPQAKIVCGFTTTQMPQFSLSDRQIDALISYLKTVQ